MSWTLLTQSQYSVTGWSGGTTTQLAISPAEAVYGDRDFLWRLSSARVELEHSYFTPLPDYNRLISILDGTLELKAGEGARFPLPALAVYSFDGGTPVESWGQCTDFNLMLRKGRCQGSLQALTLAPGSACTWTIPVSAPCRACRHDTAIYCASGTLALPEAGLTVQAHQLLLCRDAHVSQPVRMESQTGAALLTAVMDILPEQSQMERPFS